MTYCVHIGYPKAASSFLQSGLFSGAHPDIKPLKSKGKKLGDYQKLSGDYFNSSYPQTPRTLAPFDFIAKDERKKIESATYKSAKVTALSNELLCGHPFSGGVSAKEYADRIHLTLPEAKILIITRKQEDMLLSSYAHFMVKAGGICSLDRYLTSPQHMQIPWHSPHYYHYDQLASYYIKLFGKKNVFVLPFEVLKQEGEEAFLKEITSFLGVSAAERQADTPFKNARDYKDYTVLANHPWINLFAPASPANGNFGQDISGMRTGLISFFKLFTTKPCVKSRETEDRKIISKHFGTSLKVANRNLQKLTKFDLKKFGYTL